MNVIVIGLGGMGAAALAALVRRGHRALGIEQFAIGHDRGSSHGHTRVIRTAYFEAPFYVPLCQRAFTKWRELEGRTGRKLLIDCPCLTIGVPDGELVSGVRRAADEHGLAVESLTASELRRRFPAFRFGDGFVGLLEQEAGYLFVEDCVKALIDDARSVGALTIENAPVQGWETDSTGVVVRTANAEHRADRLVLTAGPWAGRWLAEAGPPLTVMRQVVWWFEPINFPTQFPVFLCDTPDGCFYGIPPAGGRGLKVARHYCAPELPSPDDVDRCVTLVDLEPVTEFLDEHLPRRAGAIEHSTTCVYTLTPDRHFVIDRISERVVVAAGFSGHGFKFAPVVGEILADLADGAAERGPELFRFDRFAISRATS